MSKITEKIKTFEDACSVLGISPDEFLISYSEKLSHHSKAFVAHLKLIVITEALNEGWKPDWSNNKWDKYYPWFRMNASSSAGRFSFSHSDNRASASLVGSRLCFKSEKLADYAGKQFEELYRDYHVIE